MFATIHAPATRGCRRFLLAALTAAVSVVAITACGSSGQQPGASSRAQSLLALSECMRSHRVPNFPDPDAQGGLNLNGTGINPFSPSFKAAQAACKKLLPDGGPPQQASEQQKQQLDAMSRCMRSHGVPGFPDPATTLPTSLQNLHQDYSIAESIAGNLFLLVPKTINIDSPAFKQAAKACDFH
ncbi:MAG: hypothetical protein ACLP50_08070 [Solirubrobacteraceae bacterium]